MPLKTVKKNTQEALSLEWILHTKGYKLNLDKKWCFGCQICSFACPKEAVKLETPLKNSGEKAQRAKVDIDLTKCNFCGICDILCPFGAISVTSGGEHLLPIVEKQSFPRLIRDIKIDPDKFPRDCIEKDVCPLKLIEASCSTPDGKTVKDPESLSDPERLGLQMKVDIRKEHCPCCGVCEVNLPEDAIHIRKFLSGRLIVNQEKCPKGCTDCLDVCPITGALYVSDEDKKVHTNERFCIYCGACKAVCPVDEALELRRTQISHTAVHSGAWNKAMERLTSPTEMTKELKTKGSLRARESVKNRVGLRGESLA